MLLPIFLLVLIGQLWAGSIQQNNMQNQQQRPNVNAQCDQGFVQIYNSCLRVYMNQLNYYMAKRICQNQGADLIKGRRRLLTEKMNMLQRTVQGRYGYWTGSYQLRENSVFMTKFPEDKYGLAMIVSENSVEIKPRMLTTMLRFICEKPLRAVTTGTGKGQNGGQIGSQVHEHKKGHRHHPHSKDVWIIKDSNSATTFSTSNMLMYLSMGLTALVMRNNC